MTKIKNSSKLPSALRVKTEKCDTIWVNRRTNAHLHGETRIQNTRINRRRQTKCLKNPWFDAQIITRIYRLYFNILQWISISYCQRVWIANKTLYIRGIKLIDCRKYLLNCENKTGCQSLKQNHLPDHPDSSMSAGPADAKSAFFFCVLYPRSRDMTPLFFTCNGTKSLCRENEMSATGRGLARAGSPDAATWGGPSPGYDSWLLTRLKNKNTEKTWWVSVFAIIGNKIWITFNLI